MALTLQRKLELAGDLAKVQPLLQRLHVLEKPKPRHRVRNAILVGGALGAGAAALVVVLRRGRRTGALPGEGVQAQTDSPLQGLPDAEFDPALIAH